MFEGIDWGKIGLAVYGQNRAERANTKAARISNEGALARISAEDQAAQRRIAFEEKAAADRNRIAREGAVLANQRLQGIVDQAAPDLERGSSHFRSIMAEDPNALSPAQLIGLEDAKRQIVRSPVFRTSGRGTTAAIADVENRVRAGALEANRRRQDGAGRQLVTRGNQAVAARTQQANVDLSTAQNAGAAVQSAGQNSGAAIQSAGQRSGDAVQDSANTRAGSELATSQSMINVLGNIIAGENKDRYKSRYRSTGAEI